MTAPTAPEVPFRPTVGDALHLAAALGIRLLDGEAGAEV